MSSEKYCSIHVHVTTYHILGNFGQVKINFGELLIFLVLIWQIGEHVS